VQHSTAEIGVHSADRGGLRTCIELLIASCYHLLEASMDLGRRETERENKEKRKIERQILIGREAAR
jgi:hypothetical protein